MKSVRKEDENRDERVLSKLAFKEGRLYSNSLGQKCAVLIT